MQLVTTDPAIRQASLATVRRLMAQGFVGVDYYDRDLVVVDAPTVEICDEADIALDNLSAEFIQVGRTPGALRTQLRCQLPQWVMRELGLDTLEGCDRYEMVLPLASRRAQEQAREILDTHLGRMLDIVKSAS